MKHNHRHGDPAYACPGCSIPDYAPAIYQTLKKQRDSLNDYRHLGAMDRGQDLNTMCVVLANSLIDLMSYLIEEETKLHELRGKGMQGLRPSGSGDRTDVEEKT